MVIQEGKEQVINKLRERLQWLTFEAGDKEYDEDEVNLIVDALAVLDPIEIPGTYFTPEEAFKRFQRNLEMVREKEAREAGEFYVSRMDQTGFWDEPQELDKELLSKFCITDESTKDTKEDDSRVGLGSRTAEAEKAYSVADINEYDDPAENEFRVQGESFPENSGERKESRLQNEALQSQDIPATPKEESAEDGALSSCPSEASSVINVADLFARFELFEKSGVDLEQLRALLLEEAEKGQHAVYREVPTTTPPKKESGSKKTGKKKRNYQSVLRTSVASILVVLIGFGSVLGVGAEKSGFFHWMKNSDEKMHGLVSAVDVSQDVSGYLIYTRFEEVPIKYLGYLWTPGNIKSEYTVQKIHIDYNEKQVKTKVIYTGADSKFLVSARNIYGEQILYIDNFFDLFEEIESVTYENGIECKYLQKINEDYTEYAAQFSHEESIYLMNTNMEYETMKDMIEKSIFALE